MPRWLLVIIIVCTLYLIAQSAVLRLHVVRPSVCPSVTLVDQNHIGWKSWKLIERTLSFALVAQKPPTYSQETEENIEKFGGDNRCGGEKVPCWSTKATISLKRVKIEEKYYYGGPIETRQRSFERYHPRPPTASSSPILGVRNPQLKNNKLQSILGLRTSNWARTFTGSIRIKVR